MQLNLNNIRSSKFVDLSEPEILDIVIEALKIAKYEFTNNHHLNVSFVSPEEMQLLNKTYRNSNKPTNVLSFEIPQNFPTGENKTLIGEIALCEEVILKESKKYKKIFENRLKHMIISVDGDSKKSSINHFVDNEFLSRDSIAFRQYASDIMPDVDMTSTYTDEDGNEKEFTVPMTVTFLWPSVGV